MAVVSRALPMSVAWLWKRRAVPLWAVAGAAALLGGLLFGLAILTKDVAALITVLPLLAATVFVWPSRRSLPLLAAGFATMPYAIYVGVVAAAGHFDVIWAVKTHGIRRLLGQVQETGFNIGDAPPLTQRIVEELSHFGSTYVLLALGPLALVSLLRRGGPPQRLLAIWYLSAALALAYAVLKGTLEEQALYMLLVPSIVIVVMAAVRLCERRTRRRWRASVSRVATVFVLTLTLTWSGVTYAWGRSQPDDGYARLRQYAAEHVPAGSSITSMSGSVSLVLQDHFRMGHHYRMGQWRTPEDRARAKAAYVVVPWRLVEQGYSDFTPRQARVLTQQAEVLFSFHGRTYGTVAVYRLPVPPLPPATGGAGGGGG